MTIPWVHLAFEVRESEALVCLFEWRLGQAREGQPGGELYDPGQHDCAMCRLRRALTVLRHAVQDTEESLPRPVPLVEKAAGHIAEKWRTGA